MSRKEPTVSCGKKGLSLVSRDGRGKGLGTAWRIGIDWKLGMAGLTSIRMTC